GDLNNIGSTTNLVAQHFANLFNGVNFSVDLSSLIGGWDGIFQVFQAAVDARAFAASIPLIGTQLAQSTQFLSDLRTKVVDNLNLTGAKTVGFVQQRLFEALGNGHL